MTWYCVRTATRQEGRAAVSLVECGVTVYVPGETRRYRHARLDEARSYPLFPGYLFADIAPGQIYQAATAEGVHKIMGLDRARETIPQRFIAWLAFHEHMGAFNRIPWTPEPIFSVGRRVRIAKGKLTGSLGVICETRGDRRVMLAIEYFGRTREINLPIAELEAA